MGEKVGVLGGLEQGLQPGGMHVILYFVSGLNSWTFTEEKNRTKTMFQYDGITFQEVNEVQKTSK